MSITNRTAEATKTWDNFDSVEIVKFLNDSEYLCTPGFILRRQIMKKFPALVAEAEEKSHTTCDDLTDSGNVSWPIELLKPLSRILKDTKFKMCSSLDIEARHWRKYLSDAERCKRDMAIKLIFALEMDEETADKFLLANGSEPLSLRNPFDYACKVAHAYGFSYEDAVTLFRAFEAKYQKKSDSDFTQLIKRDLERARKKNVASFAEVQTELLDTMSVYRDEFCFAGLGYSRQNINRLQLLLNYLMSLYPNGKNPDGTTSPFKLVKDIMDSHQIIIPEYRDMDEFDGPILEQGRGHDNYIYHNIPFTKKILIPLKSLAQTLSATMRVMEKPANAKGVNRDTVILLTYFLSSGYHYAPANIRNQLQRLLTADSKQHKDDNLRYLVAAIEGIFTGLKSLAKNETPRPKVYKNLLNLMLNAFEFTEIYPPFALDRFTLLALIDMERTPNQADNLMSRVIEKSFSLSREILEGGERTV